MARHPLLGPVVFFGFTAAIAGWVLAYILRLPGDVVPSMAIGLALLVIQFLGAVGAGRSNPSRSWLAGLGAGLLTSLINLMVLGSVLADGGSEANGVHPAAPVYILGYLLFGAALGAIGGALGARAARSAGRDAPPTDRNWLGRFAILTTAGAFALLVAGGIVTSAGAGLAVPDWPSTYGANMFLFPLSQMTGGVFIEHAHRLLGFLMGVTTAVLLVWTLISRVGLFAKATVVIASALVIIQAILGGVRVTQADTETQADNAASQLLAMVHGVTGQIYVATLALAAAALATTWQSSRAPAQREGVTGQRRLVVVALAALVIQVAFGAAVRHFDLQMHALSSHLVWSIVVLILLLAAAARTVKNFGADEAILRRAGTATNHTVILQMVLGLIVLAAAMMNRDAESPGALYIALRTPHQAIGALLMITTTLLAAWTFRLLQPPAKPAARPANNNQD